MAEIIFLGTKGEIEESTRKHKYHTSTLFIYRKFKLLIDYGTLQKFSLEKIKPNAILITHAHPDHYLWSVKSCRTNVPVYLLKDTFKNGKFKPNNFKFITSKKIKIGSFLILPFKILHSLKCSSVGFKIFLKKTSIIYTGDVVETPHKKILFHADYYIGDGSSIKANLVKKKNGKRFGHARITTQINWCKKARIKNIIFTHVGKETLKHEDEIKKKYNVIIAYDGMRIKI
ncbi:MAG: hypothetical protein KatS3mg001_567 [Candidatus Pacearchaeota archaeon]|nr:MAG: hypothetical protein KatS3mg001_567 [Candidatus Pacearchaeota archaeon]